MQFYYFDYSRVKKRMQEMNITLAEVADTMNISEQSLDKKLSNTEEFTLTEIDSFATSVLKLSPQLIPDYFFTSKVQKL